MYNVSGVQCQASRLLKVILICIWKAVFIVIVLFYLFVSYSSLVIGCVGTEVSVTFAVSQLV